jgi:hypothetical protein
VVTVFAPTRVLWSGCLSIEGETLHLALPSLPPGSASLTLSGRSDLPPATGGQTVLLTSEGGFVGYGVLVNWNRLRNGERRLEPDGDRHHHMLTLPGLPPASYALAYSPSPDWVLAAKTCAGAFAGANWVPLGPGGTASLSLDLADVQEERLRALSH